MVARADAGVHGLAGARPLQVTGPLFSALAGLCRCRCRCCPLTGCHPGLQHSTAQHTRRHPITIHHINILPPSSSLLHRQPRPASRCLQLLPQSLAPAVSLRLRRRPCAPSWPLFVARSDDATCPSTVALKIPSLSVILRPSSVRVHPLGTE